MTRHRPTYKWNGLPDHAGGVPGRVTYAQPTEPLPAGHYLMMGDNRNDSNDGTNWGPLEAWRVVGPARVVFWPPADMGVVH